MSWIRSSRGGAIGSCAMPTTNVFVGSARAGVRVMASIAKFLASRMRLQVNAEKSAVRHPSKVHFLGFRFLTAAGRPNRRPAVGEDGTTAGGDHQGDDASELGAIHHHLHGRLEPLPDRMDGVLPAVLAGRCQGSGRSRRSHPPPDQGDHRAPEEASALSSAASGRRGDPIGCRRCYYCGRGAWNRSNGRP